MYMPVTALMHVFLVWPSRQHNKLQVLGDLDMPFEDIKGPLSNWVKTESIQRQIKLRFRAFLDQYRDENNNLVYKPRIRDMCIGRSELYLASCCSSPYVPSWSLALLLHTDAVLHATLFACVALFHSLAHVMHGDTDDPLQMGSRACWWTWTSLHLFRQTSPSGCNVSPRL